MKEILDDSKWTPFELNQKNRFYKKEGLYLIEEKLTKFYQNSIIKHIFLYIYLYISIFLSKNI